MRLMEQRSNATRRETPRIQIRPTSSDPNDVGVAWQASILKSHLPESSDGFPIPFLRKATVTCFQNGHLRYPVERFYKFSSAPRGRYLHLKRRIA